MMMQASSDAKESSDYNAGAPASTVLYARLNSGELVLRLGANHPAGDMTLLETGEPVYSPVSQEGPLLTEDLIKETEEFVLRTRRSLNKAWNSFSKVSAGFFSALFRFRRLDESFFRPRGVVLLGVVVLTILARFDLGSSEEIGVPVGAAISTSSTFLKTYSNKWHLFPSSQVLGFRAESGRGLRGATAAILLARFLLIFWRRRLGLPGGGPESPVLTNDRIFHGVALFLLKGGIRVVGSPFEPDGQGTVGVFFLGCYIMYVTFFTHLFIRVPFTEFQTAILREVNVAPTQLHPNSWAAVQAFMAMCSAVDVTPTIPVFFYYFTVRPSPSGGWVSFRSVRDMTLFRPFSDSFKNFKQHYFKIIVDKAGLHEFSDGEGRPLFPFYWTRDPRRIRANSIGDLTARDLEAVRTINTLPRRISARHLVECLSLEDCGPKAFGMVLSH
ncbi:hypothetical protein LR48_Vigan03g064800 [Vigna angularis]|uniref:Uncharacterized protein n=1 Tax=Phaseolus angularis TaxID=3914 RepID=A0A0L9U3K9_PHAAN|nr:hypothetical protein LR48_Vigan03g064800 [Vigna angularis]